MFVNFDNKNIKSDILKSKTLSSKQKFLVKNNSKLKSKKIRELQQSKQTKNKSANEIGSNKTKDPSQRPLAKYSDITICHNATLQKRGDKLWSSKNDNFVAEARYRGLDCGVNKDNKTMTVSKPKYTESSILLAELEKEKAKRKALEKEIAELEKKNKELQKPKQIKQKPSNEIGSGFYVSKFRHIVTNQHVVNHCKKITLGNSINTQILADLIASDKKMI